MGRESAHWTREHRLPNDIEVTMNDVLDAVPVRWIDYFPGHWPSMGQFALLFATVGILVAIGYSIRQRWAAANEPMPPQWAVGLWIAMFLCYMAVTREFFIRVPDTDKVSMLLWCAFFWFIPAAYYGQAVLESFSSNITDHIGPFSAHIEEFSEFSSARKSALHGDIDGAVRLYRSYSNNQSAALFEAVRLLRTQNRHEEAAQLLAEIAERFVHQRMIWAEATYQLAKLEETALGNPSAAAGLLLEIIQRTPDSRFGLLALNEIGHLKEVLPAGEGQGAETEDASQEAPAAASRPVPAYSAASAKAAVERMRTKPVSPLEEDLPAEDPFFSKRMGRKAQKDAETASGPDGPASG